MITLVTKIPPVQSNRRPVPMIIQDLESAPTKTPRIDVPKGTVNLAAGKKVTSSDDFPVIGNVTLVTDGKKDAGEGYYVELFDGLQFVQIDLGESASIYAIWIWHYYVLRSVYLDVVVQISNDANFTSGVITVFNNDYDNSSKLGYGKDRPYVESNFGKLISVGGTKGRYVRLYSNGNTSTKMNHYTEVEVFGIAIN